MPTFSFLEYTPELGKVLNNVKTYVPKTSVAPNESRTQIGGVHETSEETEAAVSSTADVMVCGRDDEGNGRNLVAGQVICLGDIDEELSNISVDFPEPVYRVYYINPSYDTPTHGRFAVVKSNIAANAVGRATVSGFALARASTLGITTFYSREYHAGADKYRYFYALPSTSGEAKLADYGFAKIIEYPIAFEEVPGVNYAIVNLSDFKHDQNEQGAFDIKFQISNDNAVVKVFNSASPDSATAGMINQLNLAVPAATFSAGVYPIWMVLTYDVVNDTYSAAIQNSQPVIPAPSPTDTVRKYAVQLGYVQQASTGNYIVRMARPLGNIDIYGVWL